MRINKNIFIVALAAFVSMIACERARGTQQANPQAVTTELSAALKPVVENAIEQTRYTVTYDPSYVKLDYPGGDLPIEKGVCADVIVRAFRKGGTDLQREIHEDMARDFSAYPNKWGLSRPDSNIDHRRVPNLMTYFNRKRKAVQVTRDPKDYLPGDVVAWDLGNGLLHIGIVVNRRLPEGEKYYVVHNIGAGAKMEDVLFAWPIIGHYRYF
ncbi:MAG TPA: DUF1287 domain-containing protein [Blastocatellia bacterium]|nr:DUF1287 domain-containing protein [Blastocatellia bacterium]